MNQKRKFENKKVFLINNAGQKSLYIGLLVLTFLILLIGKADLAFVNRVSIIISDLSAPAISSISKQTKIIGNSFNYLKNTTSIREENKNLFTENIRLKKFEILSKIYENENILLKNQLNLIPQNYNNFITVKAINAPGNIFSHSLLLNAGRKDGVQKGNAVLFNGVFIGQIIRVGENSSRVLLISDVNSMIPVVVSNNRIPSILTGENLILPSLKFLPNNVKLTNGSVVQTSGHGGLLPSGLPIGFVVQNASERYFVKPSIDLNLIDYVQILLWQAEGINLKKRNSEILYKPVSPEKDLKLFEGVTSRGNIN